MRIGVESAMDIGLAFDRAQNMRDRQNLPTDDPNSLRKAAEEFESLLIEQMVRAMRKTVDKTELLGKQDHQDMFSEMLDSEYVRLMTKRGGLGIADLLVSQWQRPADRS